MTRLDSVQKKQKKQKQRHHFKYSAQHNRQTHVIAFRVFRSTFTWQTSCFTIADKIKQFAIPSHPIQWPKSACEVGNIRERPASDLISLQEGIHVFTHTHTHTVPLTDLREGVRQGPRSLARPSTRERPTISLRYIPVPSCWPRAQEKFIDQRCPWLSTLVPAMFWKRIPCCDLERWN